MEIQIPKTNSSQTVALLGSLSQVFPEHYEELLDVVRSAKYGVALELSPIKSSRTRRQESYYRKWCNAFAKHCGMTPDEMHDEMLCQTYGSTEIETQFGYRRRPNKRSGDSSRHDYSELIDTLIRIAAEMDFHVPPPEERR